MPDRTKKYFPALAVTTLTVVALAALGVAAAGAGHFSAPLTTAAPVAIKVVQKPSMAFAPLTLTTPKTLAPSAARQAAARRAAAKRVAAAKAKKAAAKATVKRVAVRKAAPSDLAKAKAALAKMKAAHPILRGVTVRYGDTHGYQAISYYKSGQIILSKTHTASVARIISHECWHIIDWRDNQHIDWGENIPPRR